MMIPIRCFTCGCVVGSAYEAYKEALNKGLVGQKALDSTGLERFCCRRMIISHVDLLKEAAPYE